MNYKSIIDSIDAAAAAYAQVVNKQEKMLLDKALNEAKSLDADASGKIRFSLANLKKLASIKSALAKAAANKSYITGVSQLAAAIGKIEEQQIAYYKSEFALKTISDGLAEKQEFVKKLAVKNTIDGLTGAGLDKGVLDGINKLLFQAVTTSASFADLTKQLHSTLVSSEGSTSSFAKYANTYAVTAMTQYAGANNKMFTEDLGVEWYRYVGSVVETTRPFCELMTKKEWIHKSEFASILKGEIDVGGVVKKIPLNAKTGLPYGMIEGTNADNLQINVGGWNCRHQLVPVAAVAVPKNIRDKFDNGNATAASASQAASAAPTPSRQYKQHIPTITTSSMSQEEAKALQYVYDDITKQKVDYLEATKMVTQLSEDEIIKRLAGGDMTGGSCSSLAFAYAANKGGIDVLDFRGGASREIFSADRNITKIAKAYGGIYQYMSGVEAMKMTQIGKEYYIGIGRHAAIVRRVGDKQYEYLELQSRRENYNGWHKLDSYVFKNRFGASGRVWCQLIDIELLYKNGEYKQMVGYINTMEADQKKGITGGMK